MASDSQPAYYYPTYHHPGLVAALVLKMQRALGSLFRIGEHSKADKEAMNLVKTLEDERELFRKISEQDDQAAFKIFYNLTCSKVYGYCLKVARSVPVATDLLQETYINLWNERKYLSGVIYPRAYAMRIASRAVYRYFSRRNGTHEALDISESEHLLDPELASQVSLETKEILQLIELAVLKLPPQQQQVFRMNKYEGHSYKEIAQHLKLSVSTVSNYLDIAMKKVRASVIGQ
ncbi:RNA polymerase sigma factor [Filimonas effusa]|uniref:Sigma-70 family RNA polymerase sigma factor n=1 Tax=Filimonas effusa TaxID=2508721 RepID=A0A4Q1D3N6_9BACT|nr:sigma-70 family RNA polymerase sigma factor [Filimonas effusa]RXK81757.1 sigma-70 family RNA polymerase sigma factor [Filimonas effusa]